jgi:hypothetical protein
LGIEKRRKNREESRRRKKELANNMTCMGQGRQVLQIPALGLYHSRGIAKRIKGKPGGKKNNNNTRQFWQDDKGLSTLTQPCWSDQRDKRK